MLTSVMRWWRERHPLAPLNRVSSVTTGDGLIRYSRSNGESGALRWDALDRVSIRTTDRGPWDDDVFFVIEAGGETLVAASDAPGVGALLTELQTLPEFDNQAVIEAMTCTDNREFLCWARAGNT